MEWAVVAGAATAGLVVGAIAGPWVLRALRASRTRDPEVHASDGRQAIAADDPLPGLGRKSLDSLRVGVVVLDEDDNPVLANPAARAMGLLRAGSELGTVVAHPIMRTLAGQVRRTGVRREVELDLPRGDGAAEPLGVHLRAVGWTAAHVAVEAADVTEAHRVARVRRDFVANVSHELKTPIGALQLLAEALLDATDAAPDGRTPRAWRSVAASGRGRGRRAAVRRTDPRTSPPGSAGWSPSCSSCPGCRAPNRCPSRSRSPSTGWSPRWSTAPAPPPPPSTSTWPSRATRGLTVYGNECQLATAVANLVENAHRVLALEDTTVTIATRATATRSQIAVPTRASASPPTTSTGSSSGSTGPTRPARGPPAAPGSAWPSSSTSPPTMAAAST